MFPLPTLKAPRFLRDTRGSVSVEAVLIAPLLVWGMVATYVFYDGFRHKTRVQIAANTVVDVLSRQTATITPQFVNDLNGVFDALALGRGSTSMRVTSVAQVTADAAPVIAWSHGTRGVAPARTLAQLNGQVPPILTGEAAIVVETFGSWTPPFTLLGMESLVNLNSQVTSRPRFVPWLHFEGSQPIFTNFNSEWSDPNVGYDAILADPYMPTAPNANSNSSGNGAWTGTGNSTRQPTGNSSANANSNGNSGVQRDPAQSNGGGAGQSLGDPDIPFRQVGLWEFDSAAAPNRDEAAINNQAIPVGRIGLPQWRPNSAGLYQNDGGYHLDNCVASSSIGRTNNDNRRQVVIPWHNSYDLESATLRMVFRTDGLPANNTYGYNPSDRTAWWDTNNNSSWALFSRDASMQNEPGHFSAFVMGDGAVLVRFQVWSNAQFYGQQYAGTNFFLFAPPGSVQPGVNYDMQITFDHDRSMMDLYLNGVRMDRREDVPITLAGNREFWQLGASAIHTSTGQYNTPDADRSWFCGTIFHFEVWEGAFTPREIELQTCAPAPYTEEWYEYYYTTMGRYPLPSDLTGDVRDSARCNTGTPPVGVCTDQIVHLDPLNTSVPFWVDPANIRVGDYVVFNNVAMTPNLDPVGARLELVAKSNAGLHVRMLKDGDGTIHLNGVGGPSGTGDPAMRGQTADFAIRFFNQNTNAPVNLTGAMTWMDIDAVTDSAGFAEEEVFFRRQDFVDYLLSDTTTVTRRDAGDWVSFVGTINTGPENRDAWSTGRFENRNMVTMRFNARNFETGYAVAQDSLSCVGGNISQPTGPINIANMNFESGDTTNWSVNNTDWSASHTRFLGRFGESQSISYTRTLPGGTTLLETSFDLYAIDSWDGSGPAHTGPNGDRWQLLVNGEVITSQTFLHAMSPGSVSVRTATRAVNGVTYDVRMELVSVGTNTGFGGWPDMVWRVTLSVTNPPLNFTLGMRSDLNSAINDESWGIDNFTMTITQGGGA